MGKKVALWRGVFSVLLFVWFAVGAYAIPVTITATGDNYIYYYNWVTGHWERLGVKDYNSWKSSASIDLEYTGGYLVFAVKDKGVGSSGNPAGFLAQIDVPQRAAILSGSNWEVFAIADGWIGGVPEFDVGDYLSRTGWVSADWYADNTGKINPEHLEADGRDRDGISFWFEENGGQSISDIDSRAQWIWTDKNFSANMDKGALFRMRIPQPNSVPDPVVPEPGTLSLFLLGCLFWIVRPSRLRD